jgi:RNA polymerase sigma factor (sigma-70 family)
VEEPLPLPGAPAELSPEGLCERYSARVYRFAALVAGSSHDAEDLAQTAVERAIRALPGFDPRRGEVEAWLWRIVANAASDARRRERRRWLLLRALASRAERAPAERPAETPDEVLLAAVRRLPDRQRAAIALRYGADLDLRAVGTTLGVSEAAASMLVHRTLDRLRRELPAHGRPAEEVQR